MLLGRMSCVTFFSYRTATCRYNAKLYYKQNLAISSRENILSPASIRGYRQCRSYFGSIKDKPLDTFDQDFVTVFMNRFAANHNPKTCRNAHGLLSAILRDYAGLTLKTKLPQKVIPKYTLPKSGQLVDLSPDVITHRFNRALKRLEIPSFRFHDLRHYAASIMHAMGVPDQYIMATGGRKSDGVLKAVYRNTISTYEKMYDDKMMAHFEKFNAGKGAK